MSEKGRSTWILQKDHDIYVSMYKGEKLHMTQKTIFKLFLPMFVSLIDAGIDFFVPTHPDINSKGILYFGYFMLIVACWFLVVGSVACAKKGYRVRYVHKVKFYVAVLLFIGSVDIVTDKMMALPAVYFPSVNNVLACAIDEWEMLAACTLYSVRLLFLGIIIGGVLGVFTGVLIGWSKTVNYWIAPIARFVGPLPTAIWIPIALLVFPSLLSASVFIVALTMWFPTNVQTSSGIQNVAKGYYDVADTLGASTAYQIFHIAIPAAAPQIFVGIFSGVTASFISLMLAELMGSKYGIGWYINWKQQIMAYPNVWIALIILAVLCYSTIQLLFILRKRFLGWQEGMIRW